MHGMLEQMRASTSVVSRQVSRRPVCTAADKRHQRLCRSAEQTSEVQTPVRKAPKWACHHAGLPETCIRPARASPCLYVQLFCGL